MKNNGFALTIDAVIAIFVVIIAIISIGGIQQNAGEYSSQRLIQKNLADDLVELSINMNQLQTYDQNVIEDFFSNALPVNYRYQIEIERYTGTGPFTLDTNYLFGYTGGDFNTQRYIESRGTFLTFTGGTPNNIESYNVAKFRLWVKYIE